MAQLNSANALIVVAVLGCFLCFHASAQGTSVIQIARSVDANLNAPLLVLDAGSLQAKPAATLATAPRVDTEQKCALLCQGFKGCNAYVYCNSPSGCPGDCNGYTNQNGALLPCSSGADNYQFVSFPITQFGAFKSPAAGNGCQPGSSNWPRGLCSLKAVTGTPAFFGGTNTGWITGIISSLSTKPCGGIPFALCDVCYSLATSALQQSCLTCAQNVYTATAAKNLVKATAGWFCLWCINSKQDVTRCSQCLKENVDLGVPYLCV